MASIIWMVTGLGGGSSIVTSALMALESWAHDRIEAKDPIDRVIDDVIGAGNAPAAYLLLVVDLLLSHWPKSQDAAIPFLACPELLCFDRQREVVENNKIPDIFGVEELLKRKEPIGKASLDSLKERPSRRRTLDQLLRFYAQAEFSEKRNTLASLLRSAASRLGPPNEQSDLGDPEFMVVHSLNLIDPKNWRKITVQTEKGPSEVLEYVSPSTESEHLKPLQDASRERFSDANMQAWIRIALDDAARSSPEFASTAIRWAQEVMQRPSGDETEQWLCDEAIVSAAMIVVRDGGTDLISMHLPWIRETFKRALKSKDDPVHRTRSGLQFNPIAIAFVGMVLLLKNRFAHEDIRIILEAAASDDPAAAQGLPAVVETLMSIDDRLLRAMLRCAFAACVRPHRLWTRPKEEYAARYEIRRQQVECVLNAELAWLMGLRDEPEWPQFEPYPAHPRHRIAIGKDRWSRYVENARPELYTDYQAAALWLDNASSILDVAKMPWLHDIIKAYSAWTSVANGSELNEADDTDNPPREWNDAYFKLLAFCLPGLNSEQIDEMALGPIVRLSNDAFQGIMPIFLRSVDDVYFNGRGLQEAQAVHIRSTLAHRLLKTRNWKYQCRDCSESIDMKLGPALGAILFNEYWSLQPPKCYLKAKGIDYLEPFLPIVKEVVERGPFLFVAIGLLNLLEVSPRRTHLPLIIAAGKTWLTNKPDDKAFWIDYSMGRRLCSLIDAVFALDPQLFGSNQPLRSDIDILLAGLVRLGVSEAHCLEEALSLLK